jgi:hypothetical protein
MEHRSAPTAFLLTALLATPDSCETRETIGRVSAREIEVGELDSTGHASILLNAPTITLTDEQGHKAVLSATSLRFFAPDGKLVAETPARAAP